MAKRRNATLDYETIRKLHANLIRTDSAMQKKGASRSKQLSKRWQKQPLPRFFREILRNPFDSTSGNLVNSRVRAEITKGNELEAMKATFYANFVIQRL